MFITLIACPLAAADGNHHGGSVLTAGSPVSPGEDTTQMRDNIHVFTSTIAESGLMIVGVGQGAHGEPPARDAFFEACRLGTGYDADWYITGEKYVYGPGETIVLGGEYTFVTSSRWCGDRWRRPDGSVYYEMENHHQISDPHDYGYDYWSYYNVVFYYDPMPDSMMSVEGAWEAEWIDEGSTVCSKDYTSMYILSDHVMCADVQPDDPWDPIDIRSAFSAEDEKCVSWVRLDDFALNNTDDVTWRWYSPAGLYSEHSEDFDNPGSGSWYDWYKGYCWIDIAGYFPSVNPGNWHVDVYIKDYSGTEELVYTEYFTIAAAPDPDIAISPTSLVFDYTGMKSVHESTRRSGMPPDAHDRSGPRPPRDMHPGIPTGEKINGVLLDDVPAYDWYRGCGPTALGMVVGYWDIRGFGELVPGDASSQTSAVDAMMSSSGNWNDYCLPLDTGDNILPDLSEPPFGDEHADDCVADFMSTSQSYRSLAYGWSWYSDVGPAWVDFVEDIDDGLLPSYVNRSWSSLSWSEFTTELDEGRPMVFLVDSDADGGTDHFVTVIGYNADNQTYACLNTWDADVHWYEFAGMLPGRPFGIYGAILTRLDGVESFIVRNDGAGILHVSSVLVESGSAWIESVSPVASVDLAPGEMRAYTVRVDPALAPAGTSNDRILVYSDDPDESPYPGAVFVTLIKDSPPDPPGAPDLLPDPVCDGDDLHVTWDSVPNADYYYVYRDGGQVGDAVYTNHALLTAQTGAYAVAAGNSSGVSDPGASTWLGAAFPPSAPNAPTVTPNPYPGGTLTVSVDWLIVSGADWYEVFVDAVSAGTASQPPLAIPAQVGEYTVRAWNDCGASDPSPPTAVTVDAYSGPVWHVATTGSDLTGDGSSGSPFATIQHGLDTAAPGDTVEVADGTYTGPGNRDLDFLGKTLVLRSVSDDPLACIVDCEGTPGDPHFGFWFHSGEDTTAVVRGFTVTNAYAAAPAFAAVMGYCGPHLVPGPAYDTGTATLINCRVVGNTGDGISSYYPEEWTEGAYSFRLTDCEASSNTGYGYLIHGGDLHYSRIEGCRFNDNGSSGLRLDSNYDASNGGQATIVESEALRNGGAGMEGFGPYFTVTTITDTECSGNAGRGISFPDALTLMRVTVTGNQDGGIYASGIVDGLYLTIHDSDVLQNTGDGIFAIGGSSSASLVDLRVNENTGAGISFHVSGYLGTSDWSDLVLCDNGLDGLTVSHTNEWGGNSRLRIERSTLSDNGEYGVGYHLLGDSQLEFHNTIISHNTLGSVHPDDGVLHPVFQCSDLFGSGNGGLDANWPLEIRDQYLVDGNTRLDPLFCDRASGDYSLLETSPCLDDNNSSCGDIGALWLGCAAEVLSIATIKAYDPGTGLPVSEYVNETVTVEGVVFVDRGTYSVGGMYLADESGGINFFNTRPALEVGVGDRVRITGPLYYDGNHELYLGWPGAMLIEYAGAPEPTPYSIPNLLADYEHIGDFVSVFGEVTAASSSTITLVQGGQSVDVHIDPDTGVDASEVDVGEVWRVTGPCFNADGTMWLSPRSQVDLEYLDGSEPTSVEEIPDAFRLLACTPNPFNPSTTIAFELAESSPVRMSVYDLQGRRVRLLVDGRRPAGRHEVRWYGRTDAGLPVATGTYICRLEAGGHEFKQRMLLLK